MKNATITLLLYTNYLVSFDPKKTFNIILEVLSHIMGI